VLVRVLAFGLNRLDHYLREGSVTRDIALPHVLGSDAAGVVEALGEGVTGFSLGERVIPMPGYPLDAADADFRPISAAPSYAIRGIAEWGTYAQYMVVPARWLLRDDTGLSPEEVATLPMAVVTCVRAVKVVGEVKAGDHVLVHAGASGTGSMSVQVAKALGAKVAATVRSPDKANFVRSLGADHVIPLDGADWVDEATRWAGGGVDVIIDNLGGEVFSRSIDALRVQGCLVSMGMVTGTEATIQLRPLFFGQKQIRGTLMGDADDLRWGLDQIRAGKIKPALDRVYDLAEIAEAHTDLAVGVAKGNIVVLPWGHQS
jgi:NADPH:quinone reductase-like Zn-dependent oxidoreductase